MTKVPAWLPIALAAAICLGLFGQGNVEANPGCLQAQPGQVTVLARPGIGYDFIKLEAEGRAAPYLDAEAGRVMVPVRSLVTLITPGQGVSRWDELTRTATFQRGDRTLSFSFAPGSNRTETATVNGQRVQAEAFICEGKVMASARFVAGALESGIKWYRGNTVVIDPAWAPDSETLALQVAAGAKLPVDRGATAGGRIGRAAPAESAACTGAPTSVLDYFLSPADSSRQAARAFACHWVVP